MLGTRRSSKTSAVDLTEQEDGARDCLCLRHQEQTSGCLSYVASFVGMKMSPRDELSHLDVQAFSSPVSFLTFLP